MTALQDELGEAAELVRAEAIAAGHDPHPWGPPAALALRTACRRCGARLEVRVSAAGVQVSRPSSPCK